jgi:putative superfamily III holin-X
MTKRDEASPRRSAVALVRQLLAGFVALARLELQHGRQEIGAMLAKAGVGVAIVGVAIVVILLSLGTLDVAVVLGVAALFEALPNVAVTIVILAVFTAIIVFAVAFGTGVVSRLPWWLLLILVLVVAALIAAFALPAYLGFKAAWHAALFVFVIQLLFGLLIAYRGVRRIRVRPPEETIASVREEVAWAKRLIRRG